MAYKCGKYILVEKEEIRNGIYSYTILCPEVAAIAKAGQFVHILAEGFTLRRPISICEINAKNGTIRIVFEERGKGTAKIAKKNVGDTIDMIAPLGNGFSVSQDSEKKIIVVGGGIGVPPLLEAAKYSLENTTAMLGFRSFDRVILTDDFKALGAEVITCTDDGSYGFHGMVTVPLIEKIKSGSVDMIFACGPTPMLRAVVSAALEHNIACEVSLEERMGCGVGACVGCACKIVRAGREFTLRVCKDGPVFKAEEVVL